MLDAGKFLLFIKRSCPNYFDDLHSDKSRLKNHELFVFVSRAYSLTLQDLEKAPNGL